MIGERMKKLSVIIPAFNEQEMIEKTTLCIHNILCEANILHELLFVDDGSTDNTWFKIKESASKFNFVRGIKFSRNFGKEAAIYSGLEASKGDCCVVIDCDLQHPPQKIVEMYALWEEGFEIIEAKKSDRGKESFAHRLCANTFYRIISEITKIDMQNASDFKLMDRKVVLAILNIRERNSFFRALSSWVGFKKTSINFEVQERTVGASKWSLWGLIKYAISSITSFSTFPMQVTTLCGILTFAVSIIFAVISLAQKLSGTSLEGFTTTILLQLFFSSIIMFSLGIIGYYIAKIYEEILERPKYIITERCNEEI